jgi:pectin methylesterase-like acyl-CoA thioesterase
LVPAGKPTPDGELTKDGEPTTSGLVAVDPTIVVWRDAPGVTITTVEAALAAASTAAIVYVYVVPPATVSSVKIWDCPE